MDSVGIRVGTMRRFATGLMALTILGIASCSSERSGTEKPETEPRVPQSGSRPATGVGEVTVVSVLASSSLGQDLASDTREDVYRARSYLRKSGPADLPDAEAETLAEWRAYSKQLTAWVYQSELPVVVQLIEEYPEFVRTWSPYYMD